MKSLISILALIAVASTGLADSYISQYQGSRLYSWDGKYLTQYQGSRLFQRDGKYLSAYQGSRVFETQG